MSGDFTAVTDR